MQGDSGFLVRGLWHLIALILQAVCELLTTFSVENNTWLLTQKCQSDFDFLKEILQRLYCHNSDHWQFSSRSVWKEVTVEETQMAVDTGLFLSSRVRTYLGTLYLYLHLLQVSQISCNHVGDTNSFIPCMNYYSESVPYKMKHLNDGRPILIFWSIYCNSLSLAIVNFPSKLRVLISWATMDWNISLV